MRLRTDHVSGQHDFYLLRAAESHAAAETATLQRVRERFLRSEAAWNEMADRVERTDQMRSDKEARRAAADGW